MNMDLNLETKSDTELIELWKQISKTANARETSDATKRIPQILMMLHYELTKRGYTSIDGEWVKEEENRA